MIDKVTTALASDHAILGHAGLRVDPTFDPRPRDPGFQTLLAEGR